MTKNDPVDPRRLLRNGVLALASAMGLQFVSADDWPQWMGPRRDGVWRDTGVRDSIPSSKESEMDNGLHTIMCTPVWKDGFLYGVCGFGELRCLDATTGERRWETYATTGGEQSFFANAFLVTQGDRTWIWNNHGELILGQLSPDGFKDLGRVKLLEPWKNTRGRDVLWCHPAFANRHAYLHNGKEFLCVDLSAPGKPG